MEFVCLHKALRLHTTVLAYVYACVCSFGNKVKQTYVHDIYVHMYIFIYTHANIYNYLVYINYYTFMHKYMCVCVFVCVCVCVCVCMCVCVRTHA